MLDMLYKLLDMLPFEFISYGFMKNALIAAILIAPVFGLVGTMAVGNKMAFFSDALGHSVLTGVGIGVVLGLRMPALVMIVFSVLFAVLITTIKRNNRSSMDTVISVFSSVSVALGIVLLSKNGGVSKYSAYLVGDILSITKEELGTLFWLFIGVLVYWGASFNEIVLFSIDEELAASRNIKTRWVELNFCILTALIVSMTVRVLGILVINAMLMLPAATAANISKNLKSYTAASVFLAFFCSVAGLIFSYYIEASASAVIVVVMGFFYFAAHTVKKFLR